MPRGGPVLSVLMAVRRRDQIFLCVILWAAAGIAVKQAGTPAVAWSAWGVALVALLGAGYAVFGGRRAA